MGMMGNVVAAGAIAIAGKDDKLAAGLVDVGQNIIATAAGAGIGSAFGGSASMNGAQIGSSLQQYNWGGSSAATATALNNARPILAAIAAGGTLAEIGAVVAGVVLAPEVAAVGAAGAVGAAVIGGIIYAENKKDDSTAHNATNTANDNASQNADKANQNNQQSGTISNGGAMSPDNQPPEDPKDNKNSNNNNSHNNQPATNPPAPTDASQNQVDIPQKAEDVLQQAENKGSPMQGYKGGRIYNNDPLPGAQKLPTQDAEGNPITYKEWDTDPTPPKNSGGRGAGRVVTGSDGSAYYTDDHYHTFNKMRNYTPRRVK